MSHLIALTTATSATVVAGHFAAPGHFDVAAAAVVFLTAAVCAGAVLRTIVGWGRLPVPGG